MQAYQNTATCKFMYFHDFYITCPRIWLRHGNLIATFILYRGASVLLHRSLHLYSYIQITFQVTIIFQNGRLLIQVP